MCKSVDSWVETASAVAQSLRQHWDYAGGQINAIAAPSRLAIQRAPGFYIGGDVGNVHAEAPTAVGLFNLNRVIEIACIIRIDRDDKVFAQDIASFELPCIDSFRHLVRLIQNIIRKFCRQMIFADDREHVDARSGGRPEHFDDFPFRIDVPRFPGFQANHDFVANIRGCPWLLISLRMDIDVVHKPRIIGHDIVKVSRPLQCADDGIVSALQDSNDTSFAPPFDAVIRRIARYARNHAVAMHGCPDILCCDENIRPTGCFWCEKSVADLMNRQFAGYEVRLSRKHISVLADARDLTRALELTQGFPQCNSFTGSQAKFASDIGLVERPVIFSCQQRQNLFSNLTSVYSHLGETIASSLTT